ncbi:MAG: hypothetical protein JNM17_17720 [Archangium sp.]|nr:hypothetical protein [Archangium sp.]
MKRPVVAVLVVIGALIAVLVWWNSRATAVDSSPEQTASAPDSGTAPNDVRGATAKTTAPMSTDAGMPEARTGPGTELARFGWGSGDGNLGRSRPDEANPEAPMSLTVDALGNVWILDQVNGRLVKLDKNGKPIGTVPLSVQGAQDVVVTPDGTALVMDRLIDKSIAVIGPDGKPRGEIPIVGKGLEEGGASTGVFTDGDSVYVEREHGDAVRIGSTNGTADKERPEVPGRPAQDGKTFLTANMVNGPAGVVMVTAIDRPSQAHRFTRTLTLGTPVIGLNALDADQTGIIYLGTITELAASTPEVPVFGITLLCLDPLDGRPVGMTQIPANSSPEETFRELTVLPEGGVLFLERTEQGPRVVRYGCGGP